MFENLFRDPATIERNRAAPLAEYRLRYLQHLAESGAKPNTLRTVAAELLWVIRLLELREPETVSITQIKAEAENRSKSWDHKHGRTQPASLAAMMCYYQRAIRWLRFLGWLEVPVAIQHAHTSEVAAFAAWMREERGLSDETVSVYCRMVNEFFHQLPDSRVSLASLNIIHVDRWITAKADSRKYARKTMALYATSLRAFFRFAAGRGWCRSSIASVIRPTRVFLDEPVPAGLNREDIHRLLSTTNGDGQTDKRDRAILMLLIAYGLRAGEVVRLTLEDLNWERETVRVRRVKSGQSTLFPLSRGVGRAVLRYILEVRPQRSERSLFFTLIAPIKPLSTGAVGAIVRKRLARLGIVTGRRGPHALRHAAAQHLLDEGMSMKVIGDYLGHRKQSSTAIYAKVHLNALREVADFELEGLA